MPVRESAGRRTWLRAIGRRIASEATEQTMKTISEPSVPAPSSDAQPRRPGGERHGTEEEEARASAPHRRQRHREQHPEEPTHELSLVEPEATRQRAQVGQPLRRVRIAAVAVDQDARACRPPARLRCRPRGCRRPSPPRPARRRAVRACGRKIASCGFVLPCTREVSTASTSRPWCATNSSRSRAVFESSPSFSPRARRAPRVGSTSSYRSK